MIQLQNIKNPLFQMLMEKAANIPYGILLQYISRKIKRNQKTKKFYFCVCAIFKDEAPYLREWVEYHKVIKTSHLYLYNNFSSDNYLEILTPYINEGYVTLIDFPYEYAQMKAYEDCYNRFREETTWLAFFDLDEFICPLNEYDMPSFLKKYEGYPGILVYWKMFGTNGKMKSEKDKLVTEQFTSSWPNLDGTGKVIISTYKDYTPTRMYHHFMVFEYEPLKLKIPIFNEHKHFIFFPQRYTPPKQYTIQLNHYWSKSYDEFCGKMHKSSANSKANEEIRKKWDFFFSHDKKNTAIDKSIFRFLVALKIRMKDNSNPT